MSWDLPWPLEPFWGMARSLASRRRWKALYVLSSIEDTNATSCTFDFSVSSISRRCKEKSFCQQLLGKIWATFLQVWWPEGYYDGDIECDHLQGQGQQVDLWPPDSDAGGMTPFLNMLHPIFIMSLLCRNLYLERWHFIFWGLGLVLSSDSSGSRCLSLCLCRWFIFLHLIHWLWSCWLDFCPSNVCPLKRRVGLKLEVALYK